MTQTGYFLSTTLRGLLRRVSVSRRTIVGVGVLIAISAAVVLTVLSPGAPAANAQRPTSVLGVQTTRATGTGTWAVVVGINDYPGADHDLAYAESDARAAVDAL